MATIEQRTLASSESYSCITPTVEVLRNGIESLQLVLPSHNWSLDKAQYFGEDAILMAVHCESCGLEQKAIFSNVKESAKKSLEIMQK